eukprot:augustus_masked-scaffold_62-processed-gene-0.14-mRNA-1 protein AED:1.00 eAED:1.00 QI:0/-1/0/0/-1/1/1/0/1014
MFGRKDRSESAGSHYLSPPPVKKFGGGSRRGGYSFSAHVGSDKRDSTRSDNPLFNTNNSRSSSRGSSKTFENVEDFGKTANLPPINPRSKKIVKHTPNGTAEEKQEEKMKQSFGAAAKAKVMASRLVNRVQGQRNRLSLKVAENYHEEDDEESEEDRDALKLRMLDMSPTEKMWAMKYPQRVSMGVLAVILLWSTSLTVIDAFYTYVVFPRSSYETIEAETESFQQNVVEQERNAYTICAESRVGSCTDLYTDARDSELARTNAATVANNDNLAAYEQARIESRLFLETALNVITDGESGSDINSGALAQFFIGTAVECPRISGWILGDAAAGQANASFEDYVADVDAQIELIKNQYDEKENYDTEFMNNKTEQIEQFAEELSDRFEEGAGEIVGDMADSYDNFVNCRIGNVSEPEKPEECEGQDSISDSINDMYEEYNEFAETTLAEFEEMKEDVEKFKDNLDSMIDIVDGIETAVPIDIPNPIPMPDLDPGLDTDTDRLADDIADSIAEGLEDATAANEEAINGFNNDSTEASTNIDQTYEPDNVEQTLEYNPPPIDLDAEQAWDESVVELREDLAVALDGFGSGTELPEFDPSVDIVTQFPNVSENIVSELPDSALSFFSYSEDLFGEIAANFELAKQIAKYSDIIYRLITTIALLNKYWNLSAIGKPPADVRLETAVGAKAGLKEDKYVRLAKLLTSPWVVAATSLVFIALITVAFFSLYTPFFDAYKDGCVDHDSDEIASGLSDGTMIYNNMLTTSFEYTVQDGDKLLSTDLNKLNVRIQTDCEFTFQQSLQSYENQLNQYSEIYPDFNYTVTFRNEILDCLAVSDLENELGSSGGITNPLSESVFDLQMEDMQDSFYKCDNIVACPNAGCSDPSLVLYQQRNHELACESEWFFHANFLSVMLTALTFALINYSRYQFMNGLVRLRWRELNPYDFTFLASCTLDGKHVDALIVAEHRKSMKQHIKERLKEALDEWQKGGRGIILFAIGINIPWIVACIFFAQGVYSSSS